LADGSEKLIGQVEIGDKLKAIDSNGQAVDSEVVSILHKNSNSSSKIQTFITKNNCLIWFILLLIFSFISNLL
jgi:hypothetical protein